MAPRRTMAVMRWSDMDALGHVHNARLLEYYEAARVALVADLVRLDRPAGIGLVVGRHEIDYRVPLVYRTEPVAVDLWVERIGTTSFTVGYTLCETDGSVVYGKAKTVIVAVDTSTGGPIALPEKIRTALADYLLDPASAPVGITPPATEVTT